MGSYNEAGSVILFDDGYTKALMQVPCEDLLFSPDDINMQSDVVSESRGVGYDLVGMHVPCIRYIDNPRYSAETLLAWLVSLGKKRMSKTTDPVWLHVVAQYGSEKYLKVFMANVNEQIKSTYNVLLKTDCEDVKATQGARLSLYGNVLNEMLGRHQVLPDARTKQSMAYIATSILVNKRGSPSWFADFMENVSRTGLRWTSVLNLVGTHVVRIDKERAEYEDRVGTQYDLARLTKTATDRREAELLTTIDELTRKNKRLKRHLEHHRKRPRVPDDVKPGVVDVQ